MNETSIRVSVAMATYNGEKYISEQINSILNNLKENDELIVSDDGSVDNTVKIIQNIQSKDKRLIMICGPGKGVIKNFENAINHCKGKYIFLADQDDIWMMDKVDKMLAAFHQTNAKIVLHNAKIMQDEKQNQNLFEIRNSKCGYIKNLIKNSYVGCCMAFSKDILDYILPFPKNIDMHDSWIGLMGELFNDVYMLNDMLISYRRHEDNQTQLMEHGSIFFMIRKRIIFLYQTMKRYCVVKVDYFKRNGAK